MKDLVITRIQQARIHARKGSMDRAIALLEQARAMAHGDRELLMVVLRELVDAYQIVGNSEQAGLLGDELSALDPSATTGTVELEPLNTLSSRSGRLTKTLVALGCLLVISVGVMIWLVSDRYYAPARQEPQIVEEPLDAGGIAESDGALEESSSVSSPGRGDAADRSQSATAGHQAATASPSAGSPAAQIAARTRDASIPREELLQDNVGLLIKVATYQGTVDGQELRFEVPVAGGSCFAVGRNGIMVTSKHLVTEDLDELPTDGARWNMPTLTRRRVEHLVCFGADQSDHHTVQVIHESPRHDMAIIKVAGRTFDHPLPLAGVRPRSGQKVYVAGYPDWRANHLQDNTALRAGFARSLLAVDRDFPYTLWLEQESCKPVRTTCHVRASDWRHERTSYLEVDTLFSDGMIGAPLLTENNQVAGICCAPIAGFETQGLVLTVAQVRSEIEQHVKGL